MARRALPVGPARLAVLVGTALPDIAYKGLHLGLRVPGEFLGPTHTPAGVLAMSYGFCLLFQEAERKIVFGGLVFGGMIQLFLDAFKSHLGLGGIVWAYPFSWQPYGFGLFRPENGIYITVPAILAAFGLEWLFRRGRSRR